MFKTRVLTALALAACVLLAVFVLPEKGWFLFCAALMGAAAWEWGALAGLSGLVARIYPWLSGALFLALAFLRLPAGILLGVFAGACMFWCIVVPAWLGAKWSLRAAGNLNVLLGWAMLFPAGLALLVFREISGWFPLAVMMIAWLADSFAYFTGVLFGRHKLAPSISPGKTWEGAAGALVTVAVYCWFLPDLIALFSTKPLVGTGSAQNIIWAVGSIALVAVSIVGDLLESLFKRQAGMKDSSQLLPGHGGILDRVDSLLALLPVAAAIFLAYSLGR